MTTDVLDLEGRSVLVTGAGQGVGRQVALDAAAHGARVAVNDFHLSRARATADEIVALGGNARAYACDVTDFDAVRSMVESAASDLGSIDVLVNNAGNAGPSIESLDAPLPFWETAPEQWEPWIRTNFYGVLHASRAVLPDMVKSEHGRIISVISDAGRVGEPHLAVYGGAKAGVAGFSRGLAKAVGRFNITVNCVSLSAIMTPAVADALSNPEFAQRALRAYPIRRFGQPADPSRLILFLASAAGEWITGQTYPVNGGYAISS
ncbi:SDR family NAD(P)-dependent oxidoreductase [Microbacterium sp. RD1]|uniref:SDR family NAD(P)-dependent oxidoreductase n=1 Tax=Microbacterium sp. RD1 TaxID=3457313 RepID=UPI003FA57A32